VKNGERSTGRPESQYVELDLAHHDGTGGANSEGRKGLVQRLKLYHRRTHIALKGSGQGGDCGAENPRRCSQKRHVLNLEYVETSFETKVIPQFPKRCLNGRQRQAKRWALLLRSGAHGIIVSMRMGVESQCG